MGLERSTFIRRDSGAILQDFRCEPLNDSSADHHNGRRLLRCAVRVRRSRERATSVVTSLELPEPCPAWIGSPHPSW